MTADAAAAALAAARRRPLGEAPLVALAAPGEEHPLAAVARPEVPGVDLTSWLGANPTPVARALAGAGAVLFRGFAVAEPEFRHVVEAGSRGPLLSYTYASTDRRPVDGNVYTSTEYPAAYTIPPHNEMSYASDWPMKLWFWCGQPARAGGATTLADARRVLGRLDPGVRERMAAAGVRYVRNYGRLDLSWQRVFGTDDPAAVARLCDRAGIEHSWRGDGTLRTQQCRPAIARHPRTGEDVWFNQAHLFHHSALPDDERRVLEATVADGALPRTATHADGSPIAPGHLAAVRDAYAAELTEVDWEHGDVLLVDNMLVAHGRAAFAGPRRVLVAMTEARHGAPEEPDV